MPKVKTFRVYYFDVIDNDGAEGYFDGSISQEDYIKMRRFCRRWCGGRFDMVSRCIISLKCNKTMFSKLYEPYTFEELSKEVLMLSCRIVKKEGLSYNQLRRLNVKKIERWYLECKYNPKYKKCREKVVSSYNELLQNHFVDNLY